MRKQDVLKILKFIENSGLKDSFIKDLFAILANGDVLFESEERIDAEDIVVGELTLEEKLIRTLASQYVESYNKLADQRNNSDTEDLELVYQMYALREKINALENLFWSTVLPRAEKQSSGAQYVAYIKEGDKIVLTPSLDFLDDVETARPH